MDTSKDYTLTGSVHHIGKTKVVSDKFSVREFVVETPGEYPQLVCFQAANKKLDLVDDLEVGTGVTVHFNVRGREWKNPQTGELRYFNSLDCWRIQRHTSAPSSGPPGAEDDVPF